ncbi:DMT family transporter [Paracoccus pacificus]|uniref:DMT family transporter n=1 Tax=Paracoccus pacificus TaxID=1463598 RepID=A0ABW4R1Q8_9RHOB
MNRATLIGFSAVLLWALLALFTVGTSPMPPFQLAALSFAIGGLVGLIWTVARSKLSALRDVPPGAYVFGTLGLFGYHALYFSALRLAPPAEASLIAYLWPLLIVLGSGLLPGEKLRVRHVAGAVIAFTGAALIVGGRENAGGGISAGHLLALGAAVTWAGYSLGSRRMTSVPTEAVTVYCLLTAVLAAGVHLTVETPVWNLTTAGWLSALALGLGPVGLAFFTWDIGVKRGDIQLLGTLAYASPLLSTLVLVTAGIAPATTKLLVAALLITLGAILAAGLFGGGNRGGRRPDSQKTR